MFPAVRIAPVLLSSLLSCIASAAAWAQDGAPSLNGYVTLANGYWNRGLAQNDGLSLQLGIDYQQRRGWFVGAWAANVDYETEKTWAKPRDIESEVYGGYHRRNEDWSWTLMLGRYVYPDTSISYDWTEFGGTVGFRDRVYYTASYTDQFYGFPRSSLNQELSFALPLRGDFEIGGTLGHFALASPRVEYTHWNLGVSKVVRRFVIDLRYYESGYDYVSWLGDPQGTQYVLSVSYALRGRKPRI